MTITSGPIRTIVSKTNVPYVQIGSGKRLQIISGFAALPYCQRNQSAAFVASHNLLLIWGDDRKGLIERADDIQLDIKHMFEEQSFTYTGDTFSPKGSSKGSVITTSASETRYDNDASDEEKPRRLQLFQCIYTAFAILLLTAAIGSGFRQIAVQQVQDPDWLRLIFLITLPAQIWLSLVRH
jgi:hypothetical protein